MAKGQWKVGFKRAYLNQHDAGGHGLRRGMYGVLRGGNLDMSTSSWLEGFYDWNDT